MAEEEVALVTPDVTDNNNTTTTLKRKLDDVEPTPPADDVAVPDSSDHVDEEQKEEEKDHGGEEPAKRPRLDDVAIPDSLGDGDEEPAKRPRLDGLTDSLAGENGHKAEEENGNAEADTDTEVPIENVEAAGVAEVGKEVPSEEANEPAPVGEAEENADPQDGDSAAKDPQAPSSVDAVPDAEKAAGDESNEAAAEVVKDGDAQDQSDSGSRGMTRKIEIPNNKVGVLIGKSGDTIKSLQINSGAKIQITRDAEAEPGSATRPVELVGSLESLNKAERLIKDVIAEADAGGSPSLVARGFNAAIPAGATEIEIPVPSDKVGLVIGRGGETIRNLQTRSGARIQLITQTPSGDQCKEKKVKVTGDKKQVDMARELIKDVMNQLPGRPSQLSGNNYSQQGYRPRGPGGAPQWGNRGPPQPMPYDFHQRGPYPSQNQQYPAQSYGNYPYQGPPRSSFGAGWEHRPPAQGPPHSGGYEYYGQGGGHAANAPVSGPHSAHMPGHTSGPSMAPPHSQANYNYGQPRGGDYAQHTPYSQTAPPAQSYGHGYGDPKYDGQAPVQQPYGGQGYAPQQQGYAPQQQYNRPPPYGAPAQGAPPQGYAPPASQSADAPYQAPVSAAQPYNQTVQPHQQYPYASGAMTQTPYGSAPVTNDGYAQPQPAAGYAQQGAQPVPAYGQQTANYAQTQAPAAGYGQYPPAAQPGYGDQSAAAAATSGAAYGYQGQVDPSAYAAGQAYSAAPGAVPQQGYAQPIAAQPGYDQSVPQSGGYASAPAAAPAAPTAYGKTLSPQPAYPQYDASQQMYAAPR